MDELLLNCADRRCILSSLLQLCVHKLSVTFAAEDRTAVVKLRGHSHEHDGVACHPQTAHKGHPAESVQGPRERPIAVERPRPLHSTPKLPQHFRRSIWLYAAASVQHAARSSSLQRQRIKSSQEVSTNRIDRK